MQMMKLNITLKRMNKDEKDIEKVIIKFKFRKKDCLKRIKDYLLAKSNDFKECIWIFLCMKMKRVI